MHSYKDISELANSLAAIVESSDDAIIGKTLDGIITSWNAAAERIFGYTPEEAIGQNITLIIPKNRYDEEFVILGKVRSGQRVDHFETIRQRKDGSLVDISVTVSPIKDKDGHIIGASKVARDISKLREAERTSAYLAAIVNSSDDIIVSKNLNSIITSWNAAAERTFGYSAEEMVGQSITLLIPPDQIDEEYTILGKIKAGQRVDHFETIRRTKDGRLIDVSITVSPILDSKGNIIGASKVARDITKHKEIERTLQDLIRRKDEFLTNMSHELRTPMNAVIGLSNILLMSESLNDKERHYATTLKASADTLMELINNLLDFSKIQSDGFELENLEFDISETIQNAINLLQVKAEEKRLRLGVTYEPNLQKYYMGDPLRIQQILVNLIANSIKFTEMGYVDVIVKGIPQENNITQLFIDVRDTGIGIPDDKISIIFEKFIQADPSITRRYGGTGLGLSICKSFVEKMGGSISVKSRVGMGTTFSIEIPLANGQNNSLVDRADQDQSINKKHVLIVDDYEPNTLVLKGILDMSGYEYDVVANGLEAFRKVQTARYDVILMDVQMPEMDGFESTRRIRVYENDHDIKPAYIVAMTAHVLERDKSRCLDAGMNDFIAKPFDPKRLVQILNAHINK